MRPRSGAGRAAAQHGGGAGGCRAQRYWREIAAGFAGCELHHADVLGRLLAVYPRLDAILDTARLDLYCTSTESGCIPAVERRHRPGRRAAASLSDQPARDARPWITGRGRWKKALARAGYERRSWRRANAFHALTAREAADIKREGGRSDSLIIANRPATSAPAPGSLREPVVAYLGRIHREEPVRADRGLGATGCRPCPAPLVRYKCWLGRSHDVAALEARLETAPGSIAFLGPQFGEDKALSGTRPGSLPSLSELPVTGLGGRPPRP